MNAEKAMTKHAHDQARPQGRDTTPAKAASKHCDRSSVLHRAVFTESNRLQLSFFAGIDRTGMIQHIAQCTSDLRVNIVGGFTTRVQDRFSGSFLVAEGDKNDLKELKRQLKEHKKEPIPGKQVLPMKSYDLSYQGPDGVGLLLKISKLLTEYDINIVTMGVETILDVPNDVGALKNLDEVKRIAFIEMRIEVPREQVVNVGQVEAKVKALKPAAIVELREHKRKFHVSKTLSLPRISAN